MLAQVFDSHARGGNAADLWRMHVGGATDEQIENLARLMMQLDKLHDAQRTLVPEAGRAGEARVIDRSRIGLEGLRMMGSEPRPMQTLERKVDTTNAILDRIYRERGMSA